MCYAIGRRRSPRPHFRAEGEPAHHSLLRAAQEESASLSRRSAEEHRDLGNQLAVLPAPNVKKDVDVLRGFLGLLPSDRRYVFEFRHESWFGDDVYERDARARHRAVQEQQEDFKCPSYARQLGDTCGCISSNYNENELSQLGQARHRTT